MTTTNTIETAPTAPTDTAPQWPTKHELIALLDRFIRQRPGLEFGNYGDVSSYRAEMRGIAADKRDAERLLHFVSLYNVPLTPRSFRAFSGRLSVEFTAKGKAALTYCAGQYFPTEYRRAAASVLATAIRDYLLQGCAYDRDDGTFDRPAFERAMRKRFGRRIVARYF